MTQAERMEAYNDFARETLRKHSKEEIEEFFGIKFEKNGTGYTVFNDNVVIFEHVSDFNSINMGNALGHALVAKLTKN